MRELLLRRKEHRGVVVTPRSVVLQWKGEMESRFGLSFAVMVRQYISEMTMDLLVHRWDLGQGIGDEQRFTDDELAQVEAMVTALQPMQEQLQAAGIFGPPVALDAGADAQARALVAMGRRA